MSFFMISAQAMLPRNVSSLAAFVPIFPLKITCKRQLKSRSKWIYLLQKKKISSLVEMKL